VLEELAAKALRLIAAAASTQLDRSDLVRNKSKHENGFKERLGFAGVI
jgi:hypothetical protein